VRALIQLYQRVGKHEKDSVEHALRRITNVDSFGSPLTEGAREKSALELWGRFASESAPAAPATPAALADALALRLHAFRLRSHRRAWFAVSPKRGL
jgi:hypothetical protein